ncbi:methylenetetrahydrofolate reductase C-terminal domain-containing protein [Nakamurella sp. PAMC28650]|uniref:methylenetetrahydrofolate reductase C-terminal domain-containing protein n=1 Tax=Nakamurella sp. PAMC28650 TaxID=2762325 RepID=UPI00164EA21C|nr:methylenetetrahydrofolate reductase C-terminal domain-containing protein [Nakamurella sp. PAMC28650]QNK81223.1 methylenetetrahydrofolate reductase C-terminal domain-containing protein [Nakamurella sp. PAMC28650]
MTTTSVAVPPPHVCPKNMVYGPCGGVGHDGSCEVADHACVFLGNDLRLWPTSPAGEPEGPVRTTGGSAMLSRLARGRMVVADFPARAMDVVSLTACARILAGRVDAVLVGDSGGARVQFPPAYRAHLIQDSGLPVWAGLNCRDRNRVALEGEMAALASVSLAGHPSSVAAVHCVTGDHTETGHRPDAAPVFDLDSTRLAALARSRGHLVSVGESPATPPVDQRAARLAEKVRAGADVAFINHCGPATAVATFVDQLAPGQRPGALIACIPVVVDAGSAALLRSFTSLVLPPGYLDRILAAGNPLTEGILAAVELAEQMLAVDGIAGVNLSGGPAGGQEEQFATALAEIARALSTT